MHIIRWRNKEYTNEVLRQIHQRGWWPSVTRANGGFAKNLCQPAGANAEGVTGTRLRTGPPSLTPIAFSENGKVNSIKCCTWNTMKPQQGTAALEPIHSQEPGEPAGAPWEMQKKGQLTRKTFWRQTVCGFSSHSTSLLPDRTLQKAKRGHNKTVFCGAHTPRRRGVWRGHSPQLLLWALQKLNLPAGSSWE